MSNQPQGEASLFQMRELIKTWDALRDAGAVMTNAHCDFGHVLTLRAEIMSRIVEEARKICTADEVTS